MPLQSQAVSGHRDEAGLPLSLQAAISGRDEAHYALATKITTRPRSPLAPRLVLRAAVYYYGVIYLLFVCLRLPPRRWWAAAEGVYEGIRVRDLASQVWAGHVHRCLRRGRSGGTGAAGLGAPFEEDGQCCSKASCFGASSVRRAAHAQTRRVVCEPFNPPRQYSGRSRGRVLRMLEQATYRPPTRPSRTIIMLGSGCSTWTSSGDALPHNSIQWRDPFHRKGVSTGFDFIWWWRQPFRRCLPPVSSYHGMGISLLVQCWGQGDGLPATAFQHRASPGGLPGRKPHPNSPDSPSTFLFGQGSQPARYQATRPPARRCRGNHSCSTDEQPNNLPRHRNGGPAP